jgi:hypothetical protein
MTTFLVRHCSTGREVLVRGMDRAYQAWMVACSSLGNAAYGDCEVTAVSVGESVQQLPNEQSQRPIANSDGFTAGELCL